MQFARSITADPAKVSAQRSLDLRTWTTTDSLLVNLGPSGTNAESIQISIPIGSAVKKFARLSDTP